MNNSIEIAKALRTCFGNFDHVKRVMRRMNELFEYSCAVSEEPEHLMVLGESGVGKSTLLKRFRDKHPRVERDEFTEIPVLYAVVQPGSKIRRLAKSMLLALGSKFWNKGDEAELRHQLVCLLQACRVRMVILDEANHLIDRGRAQTHHNIADWIKELSDEVGIPFVLAGIPRARRLIDTNDQLRSRFREVITIERFSGESEAKFGEFRRVLKAFSRPLKGISGVTLSDEEIAKKMLFATDGRLRDIRRLFVRTVQLAFARQVPGISMHTLAQAFREVILPGAKSTRNPFSKSFSGMPLTNPGEPFAPREE